MNFINLINECLNYFFVTHDMLTCKFIIKFVVSLTSLLFFFFLRAQPLEKKIIKFWAFDNGVGLFPKVKIFFVVAP